jgi:hypothetical protein
VAPAFKAWVMRQDIVGLPQWVGLLFGGSKLAIGAAQLVLDFGGHGFAVGSYCHARDGDYLPVALVGLLLVSLPMLFTETLVVPGSPLYQRV